MKYADKFDKYLNGELGEQEAREVQEDIEKLQVLLSHVDEELDEELYENEQGTGAGGREQELGREVSKAVNRKLRRYAVVTGLIVLVLVPVVVYGMSPLLDKICYDPDRQEVVRTTNKGMEAEIIYNPFALAMTVYMELFCGDQGWADVSMRPEGYGRYSIDVQTQINGEVTHHPLELVRNHLYRQDLSWNRADMPDNAFTHCYSYSDGYCGEAQARVQEKLADVPEALKIRAAVSFSDMKNVQELVEFMDRYETCYLYFPIDVGNSGGGYWGFSPKSAGLSLTDTYDREKYPYLDIWQYEGEGSVPAGVYEQHVMSMLNYMLDQEEFLKIFDSDVPGVNVASMEKYRSVQRYLKDKGINCYGTVVYASKQELLDMMDDPSVDGVYMMDSHLDL